jgi:uncharacterized protein (UPF0305 family)
MENNDLEKYFLETLENCKGFISKEELDILLKKFDEAKGEIDEDEKRIKLTSLTYTLAIFVKNALGV